MPQDMPHDTVLTDVFTGHESLAPPADGLLADLDRALGARRRARLAVTGASAATAAVAAVALAASLAGGGDHGSGRRTAPLAGSTARVPSPPAAVAAPALPGPLTFRPGWLPAADARLTNYSIEPGEQYRGYDMTALGTSDLYVALTVDEHGSLPDDRKRGAEHALTVVGHAARESAVDGSYQLGVDLGSGRLLTVVLQDLGSGASAREVPAADLATAGRHIAADVTYDAADTVDPPLTVTALPPALTITGVRLSDEITAGVEDHDAVDYTLATGPDATPAVGVAIARGGGGPYLQPAAPGSTSVTLPARGATTHTTPGRRVRGHTTLVIRDDAAVELVVRDFAPGREVTLIGRSTAVDLDDLYRIADGLRWRE